MKYAAQHVPLFALPSHSKSSTTLKSLSQNQVVFWKSSKFPKSNSENQVQHELKSSKTRIDPKSSKFTKIK